MFEESGSWQYYSYYQVIGGCKHENTSELEKTELEIVGPQGVAESSGVRRADRRCGTGRRYLRGVLAAGAA